MWDSPEEIERISSDAYDSMVAWTLDQVSDLLLRRHSGWEDWEIEEGRQLVRTAHANSLRHYLAQEISTHGLRAYSGLPEPPPFKRIGPVCELQTVVTANEIVVAFADIIAVYQDPMLEVQGVDNNANVPIFRSAATRPAWRVDTSHWGSLVFGVYPVLPPFHYLLRRLNLLQHYCGDNAIIYAVSSDDAYADPLELNNLNFLKAP